MVRILVVEDEEKIRQTLIDMLELAEHDIIVADDGDVGLQLAQQEIPDLIISDIMMPNMDGYELFEAIKSDLTTVHIPFIFLTALASYDDVRTGMNLGADDYLTKPFNYSQLITAVNVRLNKHALEEQARLRLFAQRLVDLQERERTQLAHDIETSIQEPLDGLKMMLNLAQQTNDPNILKTIFHITEDIAKRTQNLSQRLMPTMINHLNIISIMVWLFEEYKSNYDFNIDFERAGHLPHCSLKTKIAIFRIVDEILNNSRLHAGTKNVIVRIAVRENRLYIDVRDDGVGFDVQQALHNDTTGLQSMFERATLLNGDLNIHSIVGDGTQVTLDLPVDISSDAVPTLPPQNELPISTISNNLSSKIRILIADDYDIIRHGLEQIISHDTAMQVVGHVDNRNDLLKLIRQQEIDLVILDLTMDGSIGFDLIKILRQQAPNLRIIGFSNQTQEIFVVEAIKSGANGYLLKQSSSLEIIDAIHKVFNGEEYISEVLSDNVFRWMLDSRSTTGKVTNIYDILTNREREIMLLAITGLTSAEIAAELSISPRTVEKHRSNLMSKLGLKTPAQLVKFATENGLLN